MTDPRIEAAVEAAWSNTFQFKEGISFPQYQNKSPEAAAEFHKAITLALAAADAAAWRPIETAPQDGTHILVPMKFIGADVVSYELGAWRETTNMLRLKDEPTHWQPLPAPPTGGGNG